MIKLAKLCKAENKREINQHLFLEREMILSLLVFVVLLVDLPAIPVLVRIWFCSSIIRLVVYFTAVVQSLSPQQLQSILAPCWVDESQFLLTILGFACNPCRSITIVRYVLNTVRQIKQKIASCIKTFPTEFKGHNTAIKIDKFAEPLYKQIMQIDIHSINSVYPSKDNSPSAVNLNTRSLLSRERVYPAALRWAWCICSPAILAYSTLLPLPLPDCMVQVLR
eukprot:gene7972-16318_t